VRRLTFALIAILCHAAQAQSPGGPSSRPISLVVTSAAGTGGDTAVRLITSRLAERLKQPVVVENRVGASGVIGADYVAKAAPDGNTLLVMAITSAILSAARTDLPFDMMRDFVHVTKLVDLPLALGLASLIKANDLKEFLALVKAAPSARALRRPCQRSVSWATTSWSMRGGGTWYPRLLQPLRRWSRASITSSVR
jgi:tripartite-type tricarboxylate transporter receptor subunit TctC